MKKIILYIQLSIISVHSTGQITRILLGNPSGRFDTTTIYYNIDLKQDILISGTTIKTINSTSIMGSGNINITSIPTPEADFFASVPTGDNGYVGSSKATAKKTLRSIDTLVNASTLATVTTAFQGGSVFEGTDGIVLNRGNALFTAYDLDKAGKSRFPILKGADAYTTGWALTGDSTWQQSITHSITLSLGGYAYIYVIEVDKELEKIAPFSARRYMGYRTSVASVDTIAGSYFCPLSEPPDNPTLISIHTTDGLSPNNHPKYRYEVVTRDRAINRTLAFGYGTAMSVEKLIGLDYGQGPGPFASRMDSFYMNRCVVMGNAIHQMSVGNHSTITNSAFIAGDRNIEQTSVVFYQTNGANETNTVKNTYFLDNYYVLYSHTGGGGTPHGRLNFHNNYVFDGSYVLKTPPADVDTLDANYVYSKNAILFLASSFSNITYLRNSILDQCRTISWNSMNVFIDNILYTMPRHHASAAFDMEADNNINVRNSIFRIKTDENNNGIGGTIFNNPDTSSRINAKYNIFVVETVTGANTNLAHCNTWGGAGTGLDTFDYNAYIIVSGTPAWFVSDPSTNGGVGFINNSFATWQTQSGQDSHSIFIDLRGTGYDLTRIFVDPDNGNYNFADTPQADSVKTLMAGMRTPVKSLSGKPSREQVVDFIENDYFLPVSSLFGNTD